MVNAQALQGQWNQIRGELKKKWGQLTEDDLRFNNGNIDQLVGKIQQRTGEAREAIEQFLTEATSQGASAISQAAGQVGQYARYAGDQAREGYNRISDQFGRGYEHIAGHDPREPRPVGRDGLRRRYPAGRRGRHGAAVALSESRTIGPASRTGPPIVRAVSALRIVHPGAGPRQRRWPAPAFSFPLPGVPSANTVENQRRRADVEST